MGLAMLAASALALREISVLPDGLLHLYVLDVGQGSANLIVTPSGRRIVDDTGPDASVLPELAKHLPLFSRRIDLLILSHPDLDHIGGAAELLRRYDVGRVLLNGAVRQSPAYAEVLREIGDRSVPVMLPDPTHDIDMGDGVVLDIVWPRQAAYREGLDGNDESVTVRVLCRGDAALLPGDIEERAERAMLRSGADIRSGILVAAHHGSKTSSSTGFLLAADPSVVAISAGKENPFGHPHAVTLRRYDALGITHRLTAEEGTIEFTMCGNPDYRMRPIHIGQPSVDITFIAVFAADGVMEAPTEPPLERSMS